MTKRAIIIIIIIITIIIIIIIIIIIMNFIKVSCLIAQVQFVGKEIKKCSSRKT